MPLWMCHDSRDARMLEQAMQKNGLGRDLVPLLISSGHAMMDLLS